MRGMTLRLRHDSGEEFRWRLYRDMRRPASWMLEDHTGYLRTLESTYAASVPRVRMIAENHGLTFLHAFD